MALAKKECTKLASNQNSYTDGVDAEKLAIEYLSNLGFTALEERYKTPYGEIDIISRKDDLIIFVEVKKRKSFGFDDPISEKQKKRITNAALQYISENPEINELNLRFDCVLIDSSNTVTHIDNAWN